MLCLPVLSVLVPFISVPALCAVGDSFLLKGLLKMQKLCSRILLIDALPTHLNCLIVKVGEDKLPFC